MASGRSQEQQREHCTHRVIAFETDGLDDGICHLLDRNLIFFTNREDDRVDLVVLAQLPQKQLGKVTRVDELTQGLASAGHDKGSAVL